MRFGKKISLSTWRLQAGERVQHSLGDVVAELLLDVHAKPAVVVAQDERRDARERACRGELLEVEVRQSPHRLLAAQRDAREGAARVVGECSAGAYPLGDLGRIVVREQEAAPRREPDELFALRGGHAADIATDLDDALERVVPRRRVVRMLERAPERRGEGAFPTARRRQESEAHARIRSPAGSKNAPCVIRAPRRRRSTWISTRVPPSERAAGTHLSPLTSPTASLRRALVTRPEGKPSITTCAPSAGSTSSSIRKPTRRSFSSRSAKCSSANLPTKSSFSSFGSQDIPEEKRF